MDSFLPGSASLVDLVDKAILVILRDGRHLHGFLRSYDQYGNIVLHDTIERVYTSTGGVATCPVGTFVVRGENIALLGESDNERDAASLDALTKLSDFSAVVLEKKKAEASQWKRTLLESKTLQSKGFCTDVSGAARTDAFQTLGI